MGLAGDNAANIIALATAAFTFRQFAIAREHNRLSVRPVLTTHTDRHFKATTYEGKGEGIAQLRLVNVGLKTCPRQLSRGARRGIARPHLAGGATTEGFVMHR